MKLKVFVILIVCISIITVPLYKMNAAEKSINDGVNVDYEIMNSWATGAVINITITNNGTSNIKGWTLNWNFTGNQQILGGWNAEYSQNGTSASAKNVDYNETIKQNTSVTIGFSISYSGNNKIPTDFTIDVKNSVPTNTASPASEWNKLPELSMNPTVVELKAWVSETYDIYPQFKQKYETELAMTKEEALAFYFADMSRESGKDGYWQMDLETGIGGAGHAWGPFQAAVTNFVGGGYDDDILNRLGMPTPDISQFKVPKVSTYAGMKRLAEGIEESRIQFGDKHTTVEYLLGTLAHHNLGHATLEIITNPGWLESYGNETLRMMNGYLIGNHMTDGKAFWTNETIPGVDGPWSGGIE